MQELVFYKCEKNRTYLKINYFFKTPFLDSLTGASILSSSCDIERLKQRIHPDILSSFIMESENMGCYSLKKKKRKIYEDKNGHSRSIFLSEVNKRKRKIVIEVSTPKQVPLEKMLNMGEIEKFVLFGKK